MTDLRHTCSNPSSTEDESCHHRAQDLILTAIDLQVKLMTRSFTIANVHVDPKFPNETKRLKVLLHLTSCKSGRSLCSLCNAGPVGEQYDGDVRILTLQCFILSTLCSVHDLTFPLACAVPEIFSKPSITSASNSASNLSVEQQALHRTICSRSSTSSAITVIASASMACDIRNAGVMTVAATEQPDVILVS